MGYAHEGLGSVEAHRQNYPAALAHYDEKYKVSQSLNRKLSIGYVSVARASILTQLGRADEARAALEEALTIAENAGKDPYKELLALVHVTSSELLMTERKFNDAIKEGETALSMAGSEFKSTAVRSKSIVGLARSMTGKGAAGQKRCEEAVNEARSLKDPYQLSQALLALAQAALNAGDAQRAFTAATEAHQRFAANGQHESERRAALVAGLGAEKSGDKTKARDLASRANTILIGLEQAWGGNGYAQYLGRADVDALQKQLRAVLT